MSTFSVPRNQNEKFNENPTKFSTEITKIIEGFV